jgi:hypothetical protein
MEESEAGAFELEKTIDALDSDNYHGCSSFWAPSRAIPSSTPAAARVSTLSWQPTCGRGHVPLGSYSSFLFHCYPLAGRIPIS